MHFFLAKLFSIAVMTYIYVYHLQNLRPMIRLICHAYSELTSACDAARAHDARPHCRLMSPFPAYTHTNFILPETRVPELYDSCNSVGLSFCI